MIFPLGPPLKRAIPCAMSHCIFMQMYWHWVRMLRNALLTQSAHSPAFYISEPSSRAADFANWGGSPPGVFSFFQKISPA